MNQILITDVYLKKVKNSIYFFKLQFIISVVLLLITLLYFLCFFNQKKSKDKISEKLLDDFSISSLYSNNSTNLPSRTSASNNTYKTNLSKNKFSVIGIIEIKTLNIIYPILSISNEELLKIAPCKFFGSNPNEIGNLCITGHNYVDNRFFSNLYDLYYGDIINITDLTRKNFRLCSLQYI